MYAYRFRQMLADKKPVIAPMDQDAWAKNLGYMESSPPELVALYGLNRHATVHVAAPAEGGGLAEIACHPEKDHPVTVADYVQMMSKHGPNHLEQIERLKKAAGKLNHRGHRGTRRFSVTLWLLLCVNRTNPASFAAAAPESIDFAASGTASAR